jgi:hypothetical protein
MLDAEAQSAAMSRLARPLDLPPTLRGHPFTLADGRALGLSEWHLTRGSSLRTPVRGVRAAGPSPGPEDVLARCRELLPVLPRDAVFSHATALDLLGVDRPAGLDRPDRLHVLVPDGQHRPRRTGVVGHRGSAATEPHLRRHGLPVLRPAALWCQLAAELSDPELVVLGDALTRRQRPVTTAEALALRVDRAPAGTRGIRRLRAALPLLRPGTDSCPETRLRLVIVAAGLPCPQVNRAVHDHAGQFVALPDLSYPTERIAIEYDGDVHRTDRRTWQRDIARRQALEHLGWRVITCTADDVRDPTNALTWIRTAEAHRRVSRN